MNFDFNLVLPTIEEMGLEERGRIHKMVDAQFIHYMRLKMPRKDGIMIENTREVIPGKIIVDTPYAHYMNTGIKYVDPKYKKGAFYSDTYGYWSRPGVKKIPSATPLHYNGEPTRGAHFVERTILENTDDIIRDIIPYLGKGNKK